MSVGPDCLNGFGFFWLGGDGMDGKVGYFMGGEVRLVSAMGGGLVCRDGMDDCVKAKKGGIRRGLTTSKEAKSARG